MGTGSNRSQAVGAVAQRVIAVGVFVGAWLAIIRVGEAALGSSSTQDGRPPRFTDVVLEFVGTSIVVIAAIHLPFTIVAVRKTIAAHRQSEKTDAFVGTEGYLLGAITRWRLRVGALIGFFAVTLALALVVLITSVDFSAIVRMVEAVRKSDEERRTVVRTESQRIFQRLDGSAVDWALLCGAVLWVAAKARGVFELVAFPVSRYHYPERSGRFLRSAALGVRRGLNATALTVIALPAVLLDYQLALRLRVFADWCRDWPLHAVCGRLDRMVSMITVNPAEAAVLLVIVPLSVTVVIHRSLYRFVALDSQEWALSDDMRPALYLRSWEADEIRVPAPALRRGAVEHFAPPRHMSFAELIAESAERQAPVLAVGKPNTSRLPGVGSMWLPDERWRDIVGAQAAEALCVVMTAGAVPAASGYAWELDLVGAARITSRLVIVFPPDLTVSQSRAPGGFLAIAEQLPAFRDLAGMDLSDETIVVARSGKRTWKAYAAEVRTDGAYCMCITQALDHFTADWDDEIDQLRPRTGYPSVERFVRDEGILGYREAMVIRWSVRGFLLFEKLRAGRRTGDRDSDAG